MKLELENFKNFKDVLIAAEQFLQEIKIEADRDGLRFRGLDKSHIAFIGMDVKSDYFDSFEIDQPDNCVIDTNELVKILKRSKNSDTLLFEFDNENVKFQFVNEDKGTKRSFNLRQIDIEYDSPTLPQIQYPVKVDIDSKLFDDGLKDCELYSEKVKLQAENENLYLIADGNFGNYKSNLQLYESVNKAESVFSLDFLKRFFKLANLSTELVLEMGNNMPLSLTMEDDDGLKVDFLLAPRIEEDY